MSMQDFEVTKNISPDREENTRLRFYVNENNNMRTQVRTLRTQLVAAQLKIRDLERRLDFSHDSNVDLQCETTLAENTLDPIHPMYRREGPNYEKAEG